MGKGETYEEFVDKFKSKLTTDDCYTPENVYETVKAWAIKEYEWGGDLSFDRSGPAATIRNTNTRKTAW
ncbi:hypothetical protein [Acidaminococcus intestini]|uniref:hypothetical protein n=1 Tax=Acidaminococcus intestini TaxID=187327 RepID=UPI0027BA7C04|nr:hypothetical protein [Acidaminococcus intestini]